VSENHLRLLIDRIADALERDEEFNIDEALLVIEQAKASLDLTYQRYQKSCPPEAKAASECVAASVTLFYGALSRLEEYTDTCEGILLEQAKSEAERASQLLESALDWAQSVAESDNPQQLY
jgi:hypothetical protein